MALVASASLIATTLVSVLATTTATAAESTITIGYINDLTGVASSTFSDGPGAAQARVDLQNAEGGVNGHKLKLVVEDDQSSPTENLTASQYLVSKGVFGIVDAGAFVFGGYKYLQQQGVPVTGGGFDGPEWAEQPNINMFSAAAPVNADIQGKYYNYTTDALFLKSIGATKVGGLAYGISESSQASIRAQLATDADVGISTCYSNYSVPFGGVDFTADALQIKAAGCNGIVASFVDASDIALSGTVKNDGITAKQLYYTGYDEDVLSSPTTISAFDGAYMADGGIFWEKPNAAAASMIKALKKYDPGYKGGIPDLGIAGSWEYTDLMIFGLEHAGKNPTRASFMKNLRKVSNYTAGGLLPAPGITFEHFGTVGMLPKESCTGFVQLKGNNFVQVDNGKLFCGKLVSYSNS
jgi:branched-chain amino acid transport system substrate-binding protein